MSMIDVQHEDVRAIGNKIKGFGEKYDEYLKELYNLVNSLSAKQVWEGQDEEKYVSTITELKPKLEMLGAKIKDYGEFLESSSQRYEASQETIMRNV